MDHAKTLDTIRTYLVDEVLEGVGADLAPDTPLLEWGVLTSLSTMRLVSFLGERFGVTIAGDQVVGRNFKDLTSITDLVLSLAAERAAGAGSR